jgi:hypothetical protein
MVLDTFIHIKYGYFSRVTPAVPDMIPDGLKGAMGERSIFEIVVFLSSMYFGSPIKIFGEWKCTQICVIISV